LFGKDLLLRPLTDEMRPTHIMEGNLLYSESTDLKDSIQNTFTETPSNVWTAMPFSLPEVTIVLSYLIF
jgi:hypothetical protein